MPFFKDIVNQRLTTSIYSHCATCGRGVGQFAIPVSGGGDDGVMVVFPEPSVQQATADRYGGGKGDWIAGSASILGILNTYYRSQNREMRHAIWATGVLQCPPLEKAKTFDSVPCLSKLNASIVERKPTVIFTVGKQVTGALFHLCYPDGFEPNRTPDDFFGYQIPTDKYNAYIVPVMSDSDVVGTPRESESIAKKYIQDHVLAGLALKNKRPFKDGEKAMPDMSRVEFLNHTNVAQKLREYCAKYKYAAFDYETNTLQPQAKNARAISAAVCFSNSHEDDWTAVVFPFTHEDVRVAWCEFLSHPIYKIGANIKFEHRWSIDHFKCPVCNWFFDVCIAGKVHDCDGSCSLKHLAHVFFGVCGYEKSTAPFITSDTEYGENKLLTHVPMQQLLTYNAIDSIMTMRVAKYQHSLLNREF